MTEEKQSPTEEATLGDVLKNICQKVEEKCSGAIAAHQGYSPSIYSSDYSGFIEIFNVPEEQKLQLEKFCQDIFEEHFFQYGIWDVGYSIRDIPTTKKYFQKEVDNILRLRAENLPDDSS